MSDYQRVVYKYGPLLGAEASQPIETIRGEVVHVGMQGAELFVWVLGDPTMPPVTRSLVVYGTGQTIANSNLRFVGTVITQRGYVWHVFEGEVAL